MPDRLAHLADRVRDDPFFLAAPLAAAQDARGWSDAQLARHLGCSERDLARLRLCRPPRPERFAEDVRRVAAHCGADAERLGELLSDARG